MSSIYRALSTASAVIRTSIRITFRATIRLLQLSVATLVGLVGIATCIIAASILLDMEPFFIVDNCIAVEVPLPVLNFAIFEDISFTVLRRMFKIPAWNAPRILISYSPVLPIPLITSRCLCSLPITNHLHSRW